VLAGLLTVTWTGGTLLVGFRRPLLYGGDRARRDADDACEGWR
jgi:hypothetical protein